MTTTARPEAAASLLAVEAEFRRELLALDERAAAARVRREAAMREAAAAGLSYRRIGELTGISHTRVKQILGQGTRPVPDAHLAPGMLEPPSSVASGLIRVMAEAGPRGWSLEELRRALERRSWPDQDLERVARGLVRDGLVLARDGGKLTVHAFTDASGEPGAAE